eukprot:g15417.t1
MFPKVYPELKEELSEEQLWEALVKYGECWTDAVIDPAAASAAVGKLMKMGSEATARDRLDNVMCRMEKYFDNPSAAAVFRNRSGTYESGPACVITESLVAGFKPAEVKDIVAGVLRMKTGWKSDPDMVFGVAEQAATDDALVEAADTFRRSSAAKNKSAVSGGARAGTSAVKSVVSGLMDRALTLPSAEVWRRVLDVRGFWPQVGGLSVGG